MSCSPESSKETKSSVNFEDLWRQLGECHQHVLQDLEAKVAKLKKERCLDAQKLEGFYNLNQQLKKQNKILQETICVLEERLQAGKCKRCSVLEDNQKNSQEQHTAIINKLKQEKKALEDDNKMQKSELEKLKRKLSDLQRSSSPDPDEGFIPASPVLTSSHCAANKLKKRKNTEKSKFIRYTEKSLPSAHTSLFIEAEKDQYSIEKELKAEVLVPDTCELEASQTDGSLNPEEVFAETCPLDLPSQHVNKARTFFQETFFRSKLLSKPSSSPSPDSTSDRSPSLLPRSKRFSSESSNINNKTAKKRKEENPMDKQDIQEEEVVRKVYRKQSTLMKERSFKGGSQNHLDQDETLCEKPNVSPVFKKPNSTVKKEVKKHLSHSRPNGENSPREFQVEPMWSMDPALALEMYESERGTDEEREENPHPAETMDSDCTWISHSLLQGRVKDEEEKTFGLGEKANDSLDGLFDTSVCGEYKSFNTVNVEGNDEPSDEEEDGEEEEDHDEDAAANSMNRRKQNVPAFAHVAVIRKKDERRKLKGTTCKECEIYYAHLPEEEKRKKLSNCSRHRFLYVPPSTPENFWEVGFPSTQTCIERGYIKDDKNPQSRSRRRQPLNALFSPKGKKKEN